VPITGLAAKLLGQTGGQRTVCVDAPVNASPHGCAQACRHPASNVREYVAPLHFESDTLHE
jgi:hypothetical protein